MNTLFIGGDGNRPNANSVCVNNMAREMMAHGHKVWILAMGDEPGQIPDTLFWRLIGRTSPRHKLIKLIRHILIMPFYPNVAPLRARKVARRAEEIVRKNEIGLVVSIFNNYENIYAGVRLKKRFGQNISVVTYHLDLRTTSANSSAFVRKYVYNHTLASLKEENNVVDKMLIPYSGRTDIEKIDGLDKNKIHYVGFPVFIEEAKIEKCELPYEKDAINIAYIGSLSFDNRNPDYILLLLEQAAGILRCKLTVHFWGDVGGLEQMLEKSPIATYNGKIDNRFVRYIMDNSDFLLNIGNAISYSMLPSKVFGMFATGKPIINVITHPQDATMPYFERYNHSIDVMEYQKSVEDAKELADKIIAMRNTSLKNSNKLFDDFRPETICEIILNEEK